MINDIGNKDNVILNDMDESIGYYKDLYAMFESVIIDALKNHDTETAQEQVEYLMELDEYINERLAGWENVENTIKEIKESYLGEQGD